MAGQPRSHLVAYALALLIVVVVGARQLRGGGSAEPPGPVAPAVRLHSAGDDAGGQAVVHVAGAVRRPGVYRLRAGARVDDAVRRAGGALRRADLTGLNLAAKVEDGRQVVVPVRAAAGAAGAAAPGAAAAPVDLNTATPEQLDTLDGIGPAMARKILDHRARHGGFASVEDLRQIPGFGDRRIAALREQVRE